ncbi:hypothetical protein HWV03_21835 [Moritella sp. 36]|uniref:hypothetical protein n=1 Tax=Moritella sp. 36 TaxID=2746233 RepID=UPI001BA84ABB|nr:hypothetical protein [Moritella sp. 36]QUM87339.1 hypothetical protein HWV03_21835 [Moritella sp. 36]
MDNFQAIGQLVIKAQDLLDSIKGGAIRVMQTQFDALKVQFTDKLGAVNTELASFVIQQKNSVNTIFSDPDSRYQKVTSLSVKVGGDVDKFYPVVIRSPLSRISTLSIGRDVHFDGTWKGSMMSTFKCSEHGWGSRRGMMILERLRTRFHNTTPDLDIIGADGFLAHYGLSGSHPSGVVVWLRGGGYTYQFHSDGYPLKTVNEHINVTSTTGADISVCLGGYSATVAGSTVSLDIKTVRDTALVPSISGYERA